MIQMLSRLYENVFATIQALLENWFLGLAARLMFSSVLFWYFINSAMTKVGSGFPGMFVVKDNTYAQMFPKLFESVGFDASQISFIPYGIIAYAGTYAEFILPVLILLGLFTRAAAAGFWAFAVKRPWLYRLGTRFSVVMMRWVARAKGKITSLPGAGGWTRHRDLTAPQQGTFMDQYKRGRRS